MWLLSATATEHQVTPTEDFVSGQELSQADHHQSHLQSLCRFHGAGSRHTQLGAHFSFLKLKYLHFDLVPCVKLLTVF